jgi:hypothetical protein
MDEPPATPGQSTANTDQIAALADELHRLNQHRFVRIHNSPLRLIMFQFYRGLAFGLGSVIGATILFSMLAWWLSQFEYLPLIGDWISQLAEQVEKAQNQ